MVLAVGKGLEVDGVEVEGMEVVATVLLGPKFPALLYFCGDWNGVFLASH